MPDIADVAIVGYGPVGQALALGLTRQGHRVVVVERAAALHPLPRAVGFDHETARILQSLGIADTFPGYTAPTSRYEWRNATGQVLKAFSGLDQMGLSGWPDKLTFCQPELEKVLDAGVRAGGHAEVLQGWEVVAVEQRADRAVLRARPAARTGMGTESEREVAARFVVGCDGANSFIRRAMGSRYEELGFSADWLVVDIRPKDPKRWNADLLQICDPARPPPWCAAARAGGAWSSCYCRAKPRSP